MERQQNPLHHNHNQPQPQPNLHQENQQPQQQLLLPHGQQQLLADFPQQLHLPYQEQQQQQHFPHQEQAQPDSEMIFEDLDDLLINNTGLQWSSFFQENAGGGGGGGGGGVAGAGEQPQPQQQHPHQEQQLEEQQRLNADNEVLGVAEDIDLPVEDTGVIIVGGSAPQFTSQDGGVARAGVVPQWTEQETNEFIKIRAELDKSFMEPNKRTTNQSVTTLWEEISTKMKEKGFDRSSKACKCKWETLIKRLNEIIRSQTVEATDKLKENFPFYDKLKVIFDGRKQKGLLPEEGGGGASVNNEEDRVEKRKRKRAGTSTDRNSNLQEVLEGFMKQQMQWQKAWTEREEERRIKETEWREREEERRIKETQWREREEERAAKREAREEREEERRRRETEWRQKMEKLELDRLMKDRVIDEEKIIALREKLQRKEDM